MTEVNALGVSLAWIAGGTPEPTEPISACISSTPTTIRRRGPDTVHVTLSTDNAAAGRAGCRAFRQFQQPGFLGHGRPGCVAWVKLEHSYWDNTPAPVGMVDGGDLEHPPGAAVPVQRYPPGPAASTSATASAGGSTPYVGRHGRHAVDHDRRCPRLP